MPITKTKVRADIKQTVTSSSSTTIQHEHASSAKTNTGVDAGAKTESVKTLFEYIKPNGSINTILAFVKESKLYMDNAIASIKERVLHERERLAHVAHAEKVAKASQPKHAPEPPRTGVGSSVELATSEATVQQIESAPIGSPSVVTTEVPVATPATTTSTAEVVISKPVESNKPSYIRGTFTPRAIPAVSGTITRERDFRQNPVDTRSRPAGASGTFNRTGVGMRPNNTNGRPPMQQRTGKPTLGGRPAALDIVAPSKDRKVFDKKKDYTRTESNSKNKRTLMRMGIISMGMDDERMGTRKLKNKKIKEVITFAPIRIEKATITTENLTVKILSEKIGKTAQEIIKKLMQLGIMCNINSVVDYDTMELVASELGIALERKIDKTKEDVLTEFHNETLDDTQDLQKRPPVIAVMGHVDHGKTSLLDTIRKTSVASGEAGGITQHIGAYSVVVRDETITFLDTPGHEAFTLMRARGAQVTDIAILVVAADDGVMPQTIEAINHLKAANVPMIVAINKMDKPGANPQRIKEGLAEHGILAPDWGGDTNMVHISAKKGEGIDKLLDEILFLAEVLELRANPNRSARGSVIEAKLDKNKGAVATIIVQNGTLRTGDTIVSGLTYGRIRAMTDFKGKLVKEALPSTAVSVLGMSAVPNAGDGIFVVDDEKLAKQVISERSDKFKVQQIGMNQRASTKDDVFDKISRTLLKDLNIIVKADVQGSAEALKASLLKLTNAEIRVNVVHSGVGNINKSDIMLAEVSKSIIIGFGGIKPDAESKTEAERQGVDIRIHNIIFEVIDDIGRVVRGMEKPIYKDVILGRAQIRNIFKLSSSGVIAGCYVTSGKIVRHSYARVIRGKDIIFEGKVTSLKRFKEDVREVGNTYECGIGIDGFDGYALNDDIEVYNKEQTNKVV